MRDNLGYYLFEDISYINLCAYWNMKSVFEFKLCVVSSSPLRLHYAFILYVRFISSVIEYAYSPVTCTIN